MRKQFRVFPSCSLKSFFCLIIDSNDYYSNFPIKRCFNDNYSLSDGEPRLRGEGKSVLFILTDCRTAGSGNCPSGTSVSRALSTLWLCGRGMAALRLPARAPFMRSSVGEEVLWLCRNVWRNPRPWFLCELLHVCRPPHVLSALAFFRGGDLMGSSQRRRSRSSSNFAERTCSRRRTSTTSFYDLPLFGFICFSELDCMLIRSLLRCGWQDAAAGRLHERFLLKQNS